LQRRHHVGGRLRVLTRGADALQATVGLAAAGLGFAPHLGRNFGGALGVGGNAFGGIGVLAGAVDNIASGADVELDFLLSAAPIMMASISSPTVWAKWRTPPSSWSCRAAHQASAAPPSAAGTAAMTGPAPISLHK